MAEIVRMPKLSDTMTEGVVAKWHKKVGDTVKEGDLLAEIETDKATMEFESFVDGTLLYIGVKEKDVAPVDTILAIFGDKGEDYSALLKEEGGEKATEATPPAEKEEKTATKKEAAPAKIDTSGIDATVVKMPKLSDTMTEGVVAKWHKKVGDKVASGDLLAEIETDKATMEFESFEDGVLLHIGIEEGGSAPVDAILAIIGEKGADFETLIKAEKAGVNKTEETPKEFKEAQPQPKEETKKTSITTSGQTQNNTAKGSRIIASPLAKKIAQDRNINLSLLQGSGDGGRIIKSDVENYQGGTSATSFVGVEKYTEEPVSQMRKTIARRLGESKFSAPHFYLTIEMDMDKTIEARKAINEIAAAKISFNDFVIKAAALALKKHPKVNSSWLEDKIRYNEHVNIGVAVAVEEGLLVPVVRFADGKPLSIITSEVKEFAQKAKDKKLQPQDWEGSTFTISNLGMFGIDEFTAIINPPDACIMAVGGIKETPVVKSGQIVPGNIMKVTLSCDHRVVDGATGAAFLQTFKHLMENPVIMLGQQSI